MRPEEVRYVHEADIATHPCPGAKIISASQSVPCAELGRWFARWPIKVLMPAKAGCHCIIEHGRLTSEPAAGRPLCCLRGMLSGAVGHNTECSEIRAATPASIPELQVVYLHLIFHLQSPRQVPARMLWRSADKALSLTNVFHNLGTSSSLPIQYHGPSTRPS